MQLFPHIWPDLASPPPLVQLCQAVCVYHGEPGLGSRYYLHYKILTLTCPGGDMVAGGDMGTGPY